MLTAIDVMKLIFAVSLLQKLQFSYIYVKYTVRCYKYN